MIIQAVKLHYLQQTKEHVLKLFLNTWLYTKCTVTWKMANWLGFVIQRHGHVKTITKKDDLRKYLGNVVRYRSFIHIANQSDVFKNRLWAIPLHTKELLDFAHILAWAIISARHIFSLNAIEAFNDSLILFLFLFWSFELLHVSHLVTVVAMPSAQESLQFYFFILVRGFSELWVLMLAIITSDERALPFLLF